MSWRAVLPVIPAMLAFLVGAAVVSTDLGQLPRPGFYETAAQIIPVLIVALAIEGAAQRLWLKLRLVFKLQVFVCLALGELAAILAAAGAFAPTTRTLAREYVTRVGIAPETLDDAMKADPSGFADLLGLPVLVVEQAIKKGGEEGVISTKVLEEYLKLNPDVAARFVGPTEMWSNVMAGVTVVGLVFGFLAVLTCAFLPPEKLGTLLVDETAQAKPKPH